MRRNLSQATSNDSQIQLSITLVMRQREGQIRGKSETTGKYKKDVHKKEAVSIVSLVLCIGISSSLSDDGGHYCDNAGDIFHLML